MSVGNTSILYTVSHIYLYDTAIDIDTYYMGMCIYIIFHILLFIDYEFSFYSIFLITTSL